MPIRKNTRINNSMYDTLGNASARLYFSWAVFGLL
jgi:hypothetical protein